MWAVVRAWLCRLKHRRAPMHAATVILLPGCSGAVLPPVGEACFSPAGRAAAAFNPHHQQQRQAQQNWEDEAAEQQQQQEQERCRQKEPEPQGHDHQAPHHAQHQAQQPHQDEPTTDHQQQEGPEVALHAGQRKNSKGKKRRHADLTPEALQAKFPGNARHYRVLALMQSALEAYERWVQACMQGPQGGLPWCSVQQERHSQQQQRQQQQQQAGQQQQQQQQQKLQAEIQGQQLQGKQDGQQERQQQQWQQQGQQQQQQQQRQQQEQLQEGAPSCSGGAWQGQACDWDSRRLDQLSTVDWPSLYAMRYTLKPKVWLPGSCPEHCHTPWRGGRRQVAGEGLGAGSGDPMMPPASTWPLVATAVSCPPLPGATPCAMSLDACPSAEALPQALQHMPLPECQLIAAATAAGAAGGTATAAAAATAAGAAMTAAATAAGTGMAAEASGAVQAAVRAVAGMAAAGKATAGKATAGKATGGKATAGKATGEKATAGKATAGKAPVCMKLFGTLVSNPHGSEIWATCTVGAATASQLEFELGCQAERMAPGARFELPAPGGCAAVHGAAQGGSSAVRGAGHQCSHGGTWGGTREGAAGGAERGAAAGTARGGNGTYSGTALPAPAARSAIADAAADSADHTLAASAAANAHGAAALSVNFNSGAVVAAKAAADAVDAAATNCNAGADAAAGATVDVLGTAALGAATTNLDAGSVVPADAIADAVSAAALGTSGDASDSVAGNSANADASCGRYSWPADGRLLQVLLPPGSTYLMSHGVGTLGPLLAAGRRFDLIIMDPPWENASAKRSKRYETMPSRELLRLPLPQLLSQQGLVAMWVTNRERIHRFLEQELLPHWGLSLFRTWLWVKVDRGSGQPLIPLTNMHRHCYEHLLLLMLSGTPAAATAAGRAAAGAEAEAEAEAEAAEGAAGNAAGATVAAAAAQYSAPLASAGDDSVWSCLPADGFTLFCTPGCHSRKPFLQPLLQQLLSRQGHAAHTGHAGHAGHVDLVGHAQASSSTQDNHAQASTAPMTAFLHAAPAVVHVATAPAVTMTPSWSAAAAEVLDQDVRRHCPLAVMHDASQPQAASNASILDCRGQGHDQLGQLACQDQLGWPGQLRQLACLELFARELHEGWTSWGNEALLLQPQRVLAHAPHE